MRGAWCLGLSAQRASVVLCQRLVLGGLLPGARHQLVVGSSGVSSACSWGGVFVFPALVVLLVGLALGWCFGLRTVGVTVLEGARLWSLPWGGICVSCPLGQGWAMAEVLPVLGLPGHADVYACPLGDRHQVF